MQASKVFLIVRWPVGGIRTYLNYVFYNWESPEVELHILTPDIPEVEILKEQMRSINCVWYKTKSPDPGLKDFVSSVNAVLRECKFDLIHAHGFTSGLAIGWRLPFLRCPSIFTSHDVLNKNQFFGFRGSFKKALMSLLLNRFSIIHSVSNGSEQKLLEAIPSINKQKCCVMPNGIDVDHFFDAIALPVKNKFGLSSDIILIGFFGRFMSPKGFIHLVDAIERLERKYPGKYRVICFGAGGYVREEKADLEKRNLTHLFIFHDLVPDIAPYIKGCDLVVMPSLWEASGLVAMEVLVAGTPLVASRCVGLSEVCHDSPAILVEPASGAALEVGILEAESKGSAPFLEFSQTARSRYSIDNTRRQLQRLYSELVD